MLWEKNLPDNLKSKFQLFDSNNMDFENEGIYYSNIPFLPSKFECSCI